MLKVKEKKEMQVVFNFGSVAYVTVTIYEGKTLKECLKMQSENIDGVILDGMYIKVA
jgi:hypothetical protein